MPDINRLRWLVGRDALFLAWPLGCKATKKKWGHYTIAEMENPTYLAELKRGNIGVALGSKSNGLCCVDIDDDDAVESFLALNPALRNSFTVIGARGCKIFVKVKCEYPTGRKMKGFGEWMANSSKGTAQQAIIYGRHPDGMDYKITVASSPVVLEFKEIVWPNEVIPPALIKENTPDWTERQRDGETVDSDDTDDPVDSVDLDAITSLGSSSILSFDEVLRLSTPTEGHTNHRHIFTLARGIRGLEKKQGTPFSAKELKAHFYLWHKAAAPFLRVEQSREEYFIEFMQAYKGVKIPMGDAGENPVAMALKSAKAQPYPPEADLFETPEIKLLIATCFQLQKNSGSEPFFIPCRTFAPLVNRKRTSISQWLRHFVDLGILKVAKESTTVTATRFLYVQSN